jgi:WhiB family redox-sensing transcriptional regulator
MSEPAGITAGPAGWRTLGACRQEDPELFFPVAQTGPGLAQLEQARTICARCEVRARCLSFALETVQDHGVWGGKSEDERRALRRAQLRRLGAVPAGQQARQQASRSRRERAGASS